MLVEIAGECGLDAGEVEKLLADGADTDLVRQEIEQAQAMGVSGVPFFIFGGRIGVPGAQEPSVLRQAMAQARQEMAEAPARRTRLTSGRVVEPGDKLGRQFDARRLILARIRRRRAELERRRASRRPVEVRDQLRRALAIVVDRREVQDRRQPTGSRPKQPPRARSCAASAFAASAAKRHSSARTLASAGSSRRSHSSMTFCTSGSLSPSPASAA